MLLPQITPAVKQLLRHISCQCTIVAEQNGPEALQTRATYYLTVCQPWTRLHSVGKSKKQGQIGKTLASEASLAVVLGGRKGLRSPFFFSFFPQRGTWSQASCLLVIISFPFFSWLTSNGQQRPQYMQVTPDLPPSWLLFVWAWNTPPHFPLLGGAQCRVTTQTPGHD